MEQAVNAVPRVASDDATSLSSSYRLTARNQITSVRNRSNPNGMLEHVFEEEHDWRAHGQTSVASG